MPNQPSPQGLLDWVLSPSFCPFAWPLPGHLPKEDLVDHLSVRPSESLQSLQEGWWWGVALPLP